MASKQDIITAIKNLDTFLKIPELHGATAKMNTSGNPYAFAGGFNMVFQLNHQSKKWALRVWHVPMGKNKDRYRAISKYLSEINLPYFADFIYDEKGILVNGEFLDTIRMEWLEGLLLKEYIENNLSNKDKIKELAEAFIEMTKVLREKKISHGDLQEGNILVDNQGKIKLVDYDSVCIPQVQGQADLVTGLKGYQHPARFKGGKASLKADYFSELIIYISLLGLAENPQLWEKYEVKDTQYLLFKEGDFEDLKNSTIYHDLNGLSVEIDGLLHVLENYLLSNDIELLDPLTTYFLPPVISFSADHEAIIRGAEITLSWSTENATRVTISPDVGVVGNSGSLKIKPLSEIYTLEAQGHFEKKSTSLNLRIFPTPIIESIFVPVPRILEDLQLQIKIPDFPNLHLSYNQFSTANIEIPSQKIDVALPRFENIEIKPIKLINRLENDIYRMNLQPLISKISDLKNSLFNSLKSHT